MPINHTAIGPVWARMISAEQTEVTVVAFGWDDADPERSTGVWVLGADRSLTFIRDSSVRSLTPLTQVGVAALREELEDATQRAETRLAEVQRLEEIAALLVAERDAERRRAEAA